MLDYNIYVGPKWETMWGKEEMWSEFKIVFGEF